MLAVTLREWAFLTAGTASLVKVIVLIALIPGLLALRLNRIAVAIGLTAFSLALYGLAFLLIFLRVDVPDLWWWPPLMTNFTAISFALVWLRDRIVEPLAHVVDDAKTGGGP